VTSTFLVVKKWMLEPSTVFHVVLFANALIEKKLLAINTTVAIEVIKRFIIFPYKTCGF